MGYSRQEVIRVREEADPGAPAFFPGERGYSVLVASASERFSAALAGFLPKGVFRPVVTADSACAARQAAGQRDFDFILVNHPLPGDPDVRFAVDCCRTGGAVAVVFAAGESCGRVFDRVAEHGVYILPKPTSKEAMLQALEWMITTRERLRRFEREVQPVEEKMEEIKLVNRAKWLLISELKMSEPDAHRYIARQAMNRCVPKRAVAEDIIKLYS